MTPDFLTKILPELPPSARLLVQLIGPVAGLAFLKANAGQVVRLVSGYTPQSLARRAWFEEIVGEPAYAKLLAHYGRQPFEVPNLKTVLVRAEHAMLIADFDAGASESDLVRKYNLCNRTVRRILKQSPRMQAVEARAVRAQLDLFNQSTSTEDAHHE